MFQLPYHFTRESADYLETVDIREKSPTLELHNVYSINDTLCQMSKARGFNTYQDIATRWIEPNDNELFARQLTDCKRIARQNQKQFNTIIVVIQQYAITVKGA